MTQPTAARRWGPTAWFMTDGLIGGAFYLMVVTVAWLNAPASPWRAGLVVLSWGAIGWRVTRGIRVAISRRR